MTVSVLCHSTLKEIFAQNGLDLGTLKEDFKQYKESTIPATSFGRDAEYNHPNGLPIVREEKVLHIHLEDPNSPWDVNVEQFNKTSDIHLVYCRGFYDEQCYLLMAILSPNAHVQARDNNIMYNLGLMAEKFRERY